jgi:hypothetical protein
MIVLSPGESRQLDAQLLAQRIKISLWRTSEARRTIGMGQDGEYIWLQAWSANSGDNLTTTSFPAGWWNPPWPIVGVRRAILFFNTTGVYSDLTLYLRNSKGSSPCYFGDGQLFIISGNGAPTEFGNEIYGWMRSRFSEDYFITSKPLSSISCGQYGAFPIPKQFINPEGYTVFICVLGRDFNCASNSTGQHGSYILGSNAYLTR